AGLKRWLPGLRATVIGIPYLWLLLFFAVPFPWASSHGRKKEKQKRVASLRLLRCRPRSTPTNSCGNLSKAGWLRLRGRERHGWRDRGYMDVLAPSPAT
ncbi:hypothetical protein ABE466_10090, partial [Stenotrophomonas geniculata]|uniref:hypothetical protein n=1 Tax=Stenotrophomonas geniculata TaxID=86188 RepID=UPI00320AA70A